MKQELGAGKRYRRLAFPSGASATACPTPERALVERRNALTLVVEDELQPFDEDKSNEMHFTSSRGHAPS